MEALKAQVRAGRLVLDEPTNLGEGADIRVALIDSDEVDDREPPSCTPLSWRLRRSSMPARL